MRIILLGPPGSGKGTQAKLITESYGVPHISTGEIFRMNMECHTPLGERVREVMESGNMVSDELTNDLVSNTLEKLSGYVLDGYPRSLPQAKWFDSYCKQKNIEIDYYFFFDVCDDAVIERIKGRAKFSNRPEDASDEKIATRLRVYKEVTKPCIDYYKDNNKLTIIKDGTISEVRRIIKQIMGG